MSDVIWAALIAVLGSVLSGGLAGWLAFRVGSRQAQVTEKAVDVNADVELAKVRAENERLREEHREVDRRVRRDAYVQLLNALESIDLLTSVYTPSPTLEEFEQCLRHFRATNVGVRLVESQAVHDARDRMGALLDTLSQEVMRRLEEGQPMEDALGYPYVEQHQVMNEAGHSLSTAMRDDLAFAKN